MSAEQIDRDGGLAPCRGTLQVGTCRLSYLEWGADGPPLLLLHGITSSARTWWRVAPRLVAQGYHVYALDMPGHGESDATDDHRIDALARLVAGALGMLTPQNTMLVGHSWGGATALALASAADRPPLSGVVLIDPALAMSPSWGADRLPRYMEGVGLPPDQTLPMLSVANPDWHPYDGFWKAEALAQCRPTAVRGFFIESGSWNLTSWLGQVQVPLLLLVADQQWTVLSPDTLVAAQDALRPGMGRLLVLPGTNHNMFRGGFEQTIAALTVWLSQQADASSPAADLR